MGTNKITTDTAATANNQSQQSNEMQAYEKYDTKSARRDELGSAHNPTLYSIFYIQITVYSKFVSNTNPMIHKFVHTIYTALSIDTGSLE